MKIKNTTINPDKLSQTEGGEKDKKEITWIDELGDSALLKKDK